MARWPPRHDGKTGCARLRLPLDLSAADRPPCPSSVGATLSDSRVFPEGLPQGSVLAPLLWLVYANDVDDGMEDGVSRSLFADDVALLASGRSVDECTALSDCNPASTSSTPGWTSGRLPPASQNAAPRCSHWTRGREAAAPKLP